MKKVAISGADAASIAMRQCEPGVVAAYPITPQTPIIENFAKFAAEGLVDTEFITVESEHSVISAVIGASAAGVRAMTATSSQGLALMFEPMGVASGLRLPIIMNVANRALSGPINIHCDYSDTMGVRDSGWIQIYSETAQEVYENTLLAVKIAEEVSLPIMVCQDGFIVSHCVEPVEIFEDEKIKNFVGEYQPKRHLLNTNDPFTYGPLCLQDSFFEVKKEQEDAILKAKDSFLKHGKELSKITKRKYDVIECYNLTNAKCVIVALGSTVGNIKAFIDKKNNPNYGVLKINLFTPFPYEDVAKALRDSISIAVLDRSLSSGSNAPAYSNVLNACPNKNIQSYIYGLGGREIYEEDIEEIFQELEKGKFEKRKFIGLKNG
ncbi:MAG: pyruvate ferredoxin oxidoreductase [Nanoarchaeota archaeon]|nr:pyruvate ferredoxin oxidoreductase [Nanoarchaeota archaeon]